jgi:hypothetical protein
MDTDTSLSILDNTVKSLKVGQIISTLLIAIFFLSCGQQRKSPPQSAPMASPHPKSLLSMNSNLDIHSTIDYSSGSAVITCTLHNKGANTVHVLSGSRMPYLLKREDGTLHVLQGLHPGDPNIEYYGSEIPGSLALKPGGKLDFSLNLDPLQLTTHYAYGKLPLEVDLPIKIQFSVGIVPEAINPKTPHLYSAQGILGRQTLIDGAVLEWGR